MRHIALEGRCFVFSSCRFTRRSDYPADYAIGNPAADLISIETSRSGMELLESFSDFKFRTRFGPGVYSIRSPRCPGVDDIAKLLQKAKERLAPNQIRGQSRLRTQVSTFGGQVAL